VNEFHGHLLVSQTGAYGRFRFAGKASLDRRNVHEETVRIR
jgi:hypothetical protein